MLRQDVFSLPLRLRLHIKLYCSDYMCTLQQHNLSSAGAIKGDDCV